MESHNRYEYGESEKLDLTDLERTVRAMGFETQKTCLYDISVKMKNEPDFDIKQATYEKCGNVFVIKKEIETYMIPLENILFICIRENQNDSQIQA